VFGGLAGRTWAAGAWPAVVALALALLAVCAGLTFWLRRIPALASTR
jgi:ABC-type transporter Mla subunit MlaD